MANFLLTKLHLTCLVAGAAVLLVPASLPTSAQQPRTPPTFREAQMPETGWLGVSIEEVSEQRAQESKLPGVYGVLVMDVGADSPSAKAGLKTGDVITDYDGQRVQGVIEFRRFVRETPPGRTAKLTVWRGAAHRRFRWKSAKIRIRKIRFRA